MSEGTSPFFDLPKGWADELQRTWPSVHGILEATHAESARMPESLSVFEALNTGEPDFADIQQVAKLGMLDARAALLARDRERALSVCADAFALARDVGRTFLIGQMIATSIVRMAAPVCLEAFKGARTSDVLPVLTAIEGAWPSMAETFKKEMVFAELTFFHGSLAPATIAALPKQAAPLLNPPASVVDPGIGGLTRFRHSLFGGWARRSQVRAMWKVIEATSLSPQEADASIAAYAEQLGPAITLYGDEGGPANWLNFARRHRDARARLEMLRAVVLVEGYRAHTRQWPVAWTDVLSGTDSPPVDFRTGIPFVLVSRDDGVAIVAKPDGERTAEKIDQVLH